MPVDISERFLHRRRCRFRLGASWSEAEDEMPLWLGAACYRSEADISERFLHLESVGRPGRLRASVSAMVGSSRKGSR